MLSIIYGNGKVGLTTGMRSLRRGQALLNAQCSSPYPNCIVRSPCVRVSVRMTSTELPLATPPSGSERVGEVTVTPTESISTDHLLSTESYDASIGPKPGRLLVSRQEADDILATIKNGPITLNVNPIRIAHPSGLVALLDVSHMNRFPKALLDLYENPEIPKVGANIMRGAEKLFHDYGIIAQNLVDLGTLASVADPKSSAKKPRKNSTSMPPKTVSLGMLCKRYLKSKLEFYKFPKHPGYWDVEEAANELHCTLSIYQHLCGLCEENQLSHGDVGVSYQPTVIPEDAARILRKTSTFMRPQWLRTYRLWHDSEMSLDDIRKFIRVKTNLEMYNEMNDVYISPADDPQTQTAIYDPLKMSTVIGYIVGAVSADPKLPLDVQRLRKLVQTDRASWERHRDVLLAFLIGYRDLREVPMPPKKAKPDSPSGKRKRRIRLFRTGSTATIWV